MAFTTPKSMAYSIPLILNSLKVWSLVHGMSWRMRTASLYFRNLSRSDGNIRTENKTQNGEPSCGRLTVIEPIFMRRKLRTAHTLYMDDSHRGPPQLLMISSTRQQVIN